MKKIEDYLHWYYGAVIYYPEHKEASTICWTHLLDLWSNQGEGRQFVLALRSVYDITFEEWSELRLNFSPKICGPVTLQNRIATNTLKFHDGIELIKRGFDVFGLIEGEEGIAINIKTIPKEILKRAYDARDRSQTRQD